MTALPPEPDLAAERLAAALARRGRAVEVHGLVAHAGGEASAAAHCLAAAVAALAGIAHPAAGLAGLLLVAWSALVDLDGGRGWARGLALRGLARTVLSWPGPPPVPPADPAGPLDPEAAAPPEPAVLLCIAGGPPRRPSPLLLAPALAGLVAAVALPLPGAAAVERGALAFLVLCALAARLLPRLRRRRAEVGPGIEVFEKVDAELARGLPGPARPAAALVGGGALHHDGVEVLLLNHRHRFPRARTVVLAWQPAPGPLHLVAREGRAVGRRPDRRLLARARGLLGLPESRGLTPAARALRLGWRAVGLAGGSPDEAAAALLALARSAAAGEAPP